MRNHPLFRQDSGTGNPPPPPPPPSNFNPPPPPPPPSSGSVPGGGAPSDASASTNAIMALVLGIAAWVCSLSFLAGIPAWIIGKKEIKAIDAGQSPMAGRTMAVIGMWLGIVSTIFGALAVIFMILYFIFVGGMIFMNQ